MPTARLPRPPTTARVRAVLRRIPGGAMGALIVLAFGLRLLWVVLVPSRPVGDFAMYRESAAYLVEHRALDPQFIYMPGYVFLLAAIEALGGGLLAAKMIGVAAGTAIVAAAGGIAEGLWGRRVGLVAAALAAAWPAGVAVTSVTGTALPAGALVALALLALVRWSRERPWRAAIAFGLLMGLGAWVRAVAAPLAGLSFFYWWAVERRAPRAAARALVGMAVAFALLSPWAVRNRALYGEAFFTDSHGGHTALVGANPDTEGTYSRSLNLMFTRATGYSFLTDGPDRHRAADRAAYQLAKSWTAFEPAYAVGLLAAKADRLLSHERNLLYWPIYRQGVLAPDTRVRAFLDGHRGALERLADGFWWLVVALFVAGVVLAAPARDRRPLALLVFPAAMVVIYASFFSEVRYHLAVAPLLFPLAALALAWAVDSYRRHFHGDARAWVAIALSVVLLFVAWGGMLAAGAALRARARWAVSLCSYPTATETHLCNWRRRAPARGPSPVRGTWDGVGLRIGQAAGDDVAASTATSFPLDRGRYRLRAQVSVTGAGAGPDVVVAVTAGQSTVARALVSRGAGAVPYDHREQAALPSFSIEGIFDHEGGPLFLAFDVEPGAVGSIPDGATVWFSQLVVERFAPSVIIPRR